MIRLLLPLLLIAGVVIWFRVRASTGASALRSSSRPLKNDQLHALLARLARSAGIEKVEVRVLPDRTPNGLATNTGEIYITQGFIDAFRRGDVTAAELASVAAHEMGHLALGHMRRRMFEVAGRQAAAVLLGGIAARIIPFLGGYLMMALLDLVTARLSRRDEFEADAYATALMVRSGIGAEHQAQLLEKLPQLVSADVERKSWLASHPPTSERAARIRENASRWTTTAPPKTEET